jgi:hypothetical protein
MNKFVNFGKRSVELPAGCKDLVDVLQQAKPHPTSTFTVRSIEGLTDVAKHLLRLLELGAKSRYLVITWHEMNYVQLMNQEGVLTALAVVHENTHREQAVRGVFGAAGLVPILDEAVAGWSVRVLGYPLPGGASSIEELISDLLRTGYGLAKNVRLEFGSWESDAS